MSNFVLYSKGRGCVGFRVSGFGCRVLDSGCRVQGLGNMDGQEVENDMATGFMKGFLGSEMQGPKIFE